MNFDENIYEPVSTEALLWQQLKEQSDVCNFTVKQGNWSKRYHDCVVSVSPFVQAVMRNNFVEKSKGSPESIDMIMMFLYGQNPKLTMENVSTVMHLAEFLLIPKLKSFCVNWINNATKVDEENVEKLLNLSSIFDFEMHTLTKYIRQHLPELLGGNQLLTITDDTLENMFSDETLSYVNADMKFEFIMRWVEHSPEQRKPKLDKIVASIELPEVTASVMEKAKENTHFENLHTLFKFETATAEKNLNVWITNQPNIDGDFWVFDYGRDRWYRLVGSPHCQFTEMFAFAPGETILCLVQKTFKECVIRLHDFSVLDKLSCTSVSCVTSHKKGAVESIYIADKICYAVSYDQVTITENETMQGKLEQRFQQMAVSRGPITHYEIVNRKGTYPTRRPTFCLGAISECSEETLVAPLFSLNVGFKVKLVVNEAKLVALFSRFPKFFCIYDEQSCKMENIDINLDCNDEVTPFKDGFAILGRMKTRLIVPGTNSRVKRPVVVCGAFRKERKDACTVRVVGNKWVRFYTTNKYGDHSIVSKHLEYTLDQLDKVTVKQIEWKHIPIPDESVDKSIICNILEIAIPRLQLKCNLRCPHSTQIKDENTIRYSKNKMHALSRKRRDWILDDDDFDDNVDIRYHYDFYDDIYHNYG